MSTGAELVAIAGFVLGLAAFLLNIVPLTKFPQRALIWVVTNTLTGIACWTIAIIAIVLSAPANP